MKIIIALIMSHSLTSHAADECRGDLKLKITGLRSSAGQVKFDLDNSAETFKPAKGSRPSFKQGKAPVEEKEAEYVFKNIPCGDYAVKAYHDENGNEDLDVNFLKVPKEEYSFSNCEKCMLPPSFEKAKFTFNEQEKEITVSF